MTKEIEPPKKRVAPILCLTDEDIELYCKIDPRELTDKQFLDIARRLEVFYEEEINKLGVYFGEVLAEKVNEEDYGYLSKNEQNISSSPNDYLKWGEEIWYNLPSIFSIPTEGDYDLKNYNTTGFLTISRTNGAWVWHSEINHYTKFDTWQGERLLKIFVEDSDVFAEYN